MHNRQESLASGRLEEGLSTLAQKQQKQVEAPTKAEAKAETRVPDELAMLGKKICRSGGAGGRVVAGRALYLQLLSS